MITPDVLALDFDGVLCDGMREYFETSRRTYAQAWPEEPAPGEDLLPVFRRLRPVILSGWEMPLLVRAIILERPEAAILADWAAVRDEVAASSPRHGDAIIEFLKQLQQCPQSNSAAALAHCARAGTRCTSRQRP